MKKLIIKLLEGLGYTINNSKGNSCWVLNTIDMFLLISYISIVIYNALKLGISDLTYVATAILSCRVLMKFWIKEKDFQKDGASVSLPYTIGIVIYLLVTVILVIFYFAAGDGKTARIILSIYYVLFLIFEAIEILTRYFDAEPSKYIRN